MPLRPWWPWRIRLRFVPLNNSTIEVESHSRLSVGNGQSWGSSWGSSSETCFWSGCGYVLSRTPLSDAVACGSCCTAVLTNPTSADNRQHRSRKPAGIIQEVVAFVFQKLQEGRVRTRHIQMGLSENRVYSQWNSHLIGIMIINHWV